VSNRFHLRPAPVHTESLHAVGRAAAASALLAPWRPACYCNAPTCCAALVRRVCCALKAESCREAAAPAHCLRFENRAPINPPAARHLSAELRMTLGAQNCPFLIWITLLQHGTIGREGRFVGCSPTSEAGCTLRGLRGGKCRLAPQVACATQTEQRTTGGLTGWPAASAAHPQPTPTHPVLAAATSRSVWRHRKAGIWMMSATCWGKEKYSTLRQSCCYLD